MAKKPRSKNGKVTGKKVVTDRASKKAATAASKVLRDGRTSTYSKAAAGSALSQRSKSSGSASREAEEFSRMSLEQLLEGVDRRQRERGVEPLSEEEATRLAVEEQHSLRREINRRTRAGG